MTRGFYRLAIEAEDDDPERRNWTPQHWEDEIAAGTLTVHVQSVRYEPPPCEHPNLRWFRSEDGEKLGGCSGCGAVFASAGAGS